MKRRSSSLSSLFLPSLGSLVSALRHIAGSGKSARLGRGRPATSNSPHPQDERRQRFAVSSCSDSPPSPFGSQSGEQLTSIFGYDSSKCRLSWQCPERAHRFSWPAPALASPRLESSASGSEWRGVSSIGGEASDTTSSSPLTAVLFQSCLPIPAGIPPSLRAPPSWPRAALIDIAPMHHLTLQLQEQLRSAQPTNASLQRKLGRAQLGVIEHQERDASAVQTLMEKLNRENMEADAPMDQLVDLRNHVTRLETMLGVEKLGFHGLLDNVEQKVVALEGSLVIERLLSKELRWKAWKGDCQRKAKEAELREAVRKVTTEKCEPVIVAQALDVSSHSALEHTLTSTHISSRTRLCL
jgi:hypothetical protein